MSQQAASIFILMRKIKALPAGGCFMNDMKPGLHSEAIAALYPWQKDRRNHDRPHCPGVGLKEAKEMVEKFIERSPDMKSRMAAARAENAQSGLTWRALIGAMAAFA